jgi:hypothetical protein
MYQGSKLSPPSERRQTERRASSEEISERIRRATLRVKHALGHDDLRDNREVGAIIDECCAWAYAFGFREARTQYDAIVERRIAEVCALIGSR